MKNIIFLVVAGLSILSTSCKKEISEKTVDAPKEQVNQNFSLELDVVSNIEDNYALYYTEDNSINFDSDHVAWRGVKAQPESQTVVLSLPEEVVPTNIRIDFGISKTREDIVLEKWKMSYYGKTFEAKGSDFFKYFLPNDSIKTEIDEVNGTVKFLKAGNPANMPFFYPNAAIPAELAKLTK